jgi:outer membrane immunogenic protein
MKCLYPVAAAWAVLAATSAAAQSEDSAFTGPYAGAEAGLLEHHIYLKTHVGGALVDEGYHRSWGVGGGAFVGHDFAVSRSLRLGGEAGVTVGGETNRVLFAGGTSLALKPRYGYRLTLRGGAVIGSRIFVYATGGYGGNRYRVSNSAGVASVDESGSSFIVGGGVEYRLSRNVGLRLDFKHVDNQTNQIFVGLPVRF